MSATPQGSNPNSPSSPGGGVSARYVGLGVALGVALACGLIAYLTQRGEAAADAAAAAQRGTVALRAAADLTNQYRANPEPAAGSDLQRALQTFTAGDSELVALRVVDLVQRSLTASTVAGETSLLPLRLERQNPEHKSWYDRGLALKGAVQANRDEGRRWKEEIESQRLPGLATGPATLQQTTLQQATLQQATLQLAAPLIEPAGAEAAAGEGGEVWGVILLERRFQPAPRPLGWLRLGSTVAIAALVAAFLAWVVQHRRARLALAALVGLVAIAFFHQQALARLDQSRLAAEDAVAKALLTTAQAFAAAGASPPAELGQWDVDRFGAPRGVFSGPGTHFQIAPDRVREAFAPARFRFARVFDLAALLGLALIFFVGLGWAGRTLAALHHYREAYGYVAPAMIGMVVLVFFPFFYGITLSFTGQTLYNLHQPIYEVWNGFDNYVKILTDFDLTREGEGGKALNFANFYYTLLFTVFWTVTNVAIGTSVGLALALALNTRELAFKPIYRVLLVLPWAMPNYITALIWKGMFHQQFGVVNQVVQMMGFSAVAWFDSPSTSFLTVLATNGWLSFPFMMVVSLGALQSIPGDLYEAARVDGANRWQQFWSITLPSLKPALVPAVILSVVWTFNMFNIIYLVSQGQPGGATEILVTQAYKLAFEQYQYGYAAAYATVIFMILLVYGVWQNRVTKAYEGV